MNQFGLFAHGESFDVDAFLASSTLRPDYVWRRGDPRQYSCVDSSRSTRAPPVSAWARPLSSCGTLSTSVSNQAITFGSTGGRSESGVAPTRATSYLGDDRLHDADTAFLNAERDIRGHFGKLGAHYDMDAERSRWLIALPRISAAQARAASVLSSQETSSNPAFARALRIASGVSRKLTSAVLAQGRG